ncbi:class I SAM-dependent methyltransferase [Phenylobacterium sp.]|jgi:ubiquinone/menaquinone biosynthesis C-methylase UbiE|uniref:class I SAM-dependent methyltransferase n=1 Tax=Phenylobacterium sp. TaxID=1871053 RepID=UPI002E327A82|nr:class I SAM-dependent methyltransferase [Phenylobacterium sp.]HEX4710467.1 class I SAM-dependent methyltransferase [Phenylobacterium sp.]
MTAEGDPFSGSIPQAYDRYMGPLAFQPYAEDLATRLAGLSGDLLEVAAGTGIVTGVLDRTLPAGARITATDISQPMLDYAAGKLNSPRVAWRAADGQALPFGDASFDAVVCQFGVMFFPDRRAGYAEARRVLRPGGRYIFSVWDRIEVNEAARTVSEAMCARFASDPPDFLARVPYGYHDVDRIRTDMAAAGFERVELQTTALRGRALSAKDVAVALCQGTPLRPEIEARDVGGLQAATDAAAEALAHRFGAGPVDSQLQAHVITGLA